MAVVEVGTFIEGHCGSCDLVGAEFLPKEFCTCPQTIVPDAWMFTVFVALGCDMWVGWEGWWAPAEAPVRNISVGWEAAWAR